MEAIMLAGFLLVGLLPSGSGANPYKPTIYVRRGEDVRLRCRLASGMDPDKVSVRWKSSKDSFLTSGTRVIKHVGQIEIKQPSTNEWNLRIKSVTDTFAANYTCKADKVLLSKVQLLILVGPKIDNVGTSLTEVTVDEGGTVELTCAFTGEPVPSISWLSRGDEKHPTGITGRKLVLRDVKRYATDVYTCRGENSFGYSDYAISLFVKFPVEVDVMEKTVYVKKGGVLTLSCIAQGAPLNDTYWIDSQGQNVRSSDWHYVIEKEPAGAHVPAKFVTLVTRPGTFRVIDFGYFTCVAIGEGHVAKAKVKVVELKDSR